MERVKQLVVFIAAASIGIGGGGTDERRGRVVLVDEHRTTRVSSAVNGQQPCEEELDHEQPSRHAAWKPPAGQVDLRLVRPAWSQQRDLPVRGMMWCPRPLVLCYWPDQGALPAKGKEYPGLGYERVRDKPPMAQRQQQQRQQQQAAEAQ
ncbi:hypothetical protein QJQ45_005784 [Haematococcus lacustris]|nr:hypothetical protein QJQ45_005784 [Haematococcus lacustris]